MIDHPVDAHHSPLNAMTSNSATNAASDVFSRAAPQPPPPQPPQPSHSVLPQQGGSVHHMELTPRTPLPVGMKVQPVPPPLPQPPQYSQPPPTSRLSLPPGGSSSNGHSTLSPPNTSSSSTTTTTSHIVDSTSYTSFFTDRNQSMDDLADEFLIGPHGSPNTTTTSTSTSTSTELSKRGIVLVPDPLPAHVSDYERLQMLVPRRAYMDVLLYTRMLLEGSSSHYTSLFDAMKHLYSSKSSSNSNSNSHHYTNTIELALDTHKKDLVDIMTIHITAMMKLNLFHELNVELDTWSFCFHNHQYRQQQQQQQLPGDTNNDDAKNNPISWIPWSFHILAASTLQYRPPAHSTTSQIANSTAQQECLDVLHMIRNVISDSTNSNNTDTSSSILQVENALHNVYISMKNYRMSLQCIQRMIHLVPNIVQEDVHQLQLLHSSSHKNRSNEIIGEGENVLQRMLVMTYESEYLSRQGRILLQLGVLDGANLIFDQIKALLLSNDSSLDDRTAGDVPQGNGLESIPSLLCRVVKAQVASNDGLLKFSRGMYAEALESFNTVVQILRSISSSSSSKDDRQAQPLLIVPSIRTNLYCETMNNMSLCALYTCRLHEGIQLLEALIRENVTTNLNERVTLNLCTMYELAMDTSAALQKKKTLQCIGTRFLIQDIPVECFRIG